MIVGGLAAGDIVSVLDAASPAGINLQGASVRLGTLEIGTLAGGVGANLVVTFNDNVTAAAVEALIERLAFRHVGEPAVESRTLTLGLEDAAGTPLFSSLAAGFTPVPLASSPLPAIFGAINSSLVDLNGDGLLDLFVTGSPDGSNFPALPQVWFNTGTAMTPAFTEVPGSSTDYPLPTTPDGTLLEFGTGGSGASPGGLRNHTFVDLNGDGLKDLVGTFVNTTLSTFSKTGAASGIKAWLNTGTASDPVFTAMTGTDPFASIFVGSGEPFGFPALTGVGLGMSDLDGDGLRDLVLSNINLSTGFMFFSAWRNTGTLAAPAFTALTGAANPFDGISVTNTTGHITFQDLDADGREDLLLGSTSGALAWRNTGSGFTALAADQNPLAGLVAPANSFTVGVNAFGDLNGDGQVDVVGLTVPSVQPLTSQVRLTLWTNNAVSPRIQALVAPVDEAPTGPFEQALAPVAEDSSRVITVAELLAGWSDPEGLPLGITEVALLQGQAGTLSGDAVSGWTVQGAPDDDSQINLRYTVSDGVNAVNAIALIDLDPVNDAPFPGGADRHRAGGFRRHGTRPAAPDRSGQHRDRYPNPGGA